MAGASVAIIGGGLVGLASAYKLALAGRATRITLIEKESRVGAHQSTHNSGVLHAGLHYTPGSLKARLAREGLREMVAFCRDHGIAHEQCGKLVVATDAAECERLRALLERGRANGLQGLHWIEGDELRELEPHVAGRWGVHVPEEGIVDYAGVCAALEREIGARGVHVMLGAEVRAARRSAQARPEWLIETTAGEVHADVLVSCAGLHSDRVARLAGSRVDTRVVPFRGEYWMLRPERAGLVRNLIYPVPDPTFPFLGVHLTRMIHGGVEAGPNAVLALSREGYRWRDVNLRDLGSAFTYPGLWRFLARHPRVATYEVARSLSRGMFLKSLQKLVPALEEADLVRGSTGVRAQVMTRSGDLVQDFQIVGGGGGAVHVINAPSPAATACLAIGGEIVARIEEARRM